MNSGFDPVVVAPSLWKVQTATQQTPFRFGGSQVPAHLGSRGSGMMRKKIVPYQQQERPVMRINRPQTIPRSVMGDGVKRKFDGSMMGSLERNVPSDRDRAMLMERFDKIREHLGKTVAGRSRIGRWEQAREDIVPLIQGANTFERLASVDDVISQFRTKMLGYFDLLDIYED